MNWYRTRKRMRRTQAAPTRESVVEPSPVRREDAVRAGSICVASGKGGTGKSLVTASLAAEFSRLGRTLIVDADMGVGNAHILQNVSPTHSFVDVIESEMPVREVVTSSTRSLPT